VSVNKGDTTLWAMTPNITKVSILILNVTTLSILVLERNNKYNTK